MSWSEIECPKCGERFNSSKADKSQVEGQCKPVLRKMGRADGSNTCSALTIGKKGVSIQWGQGKQ